MMLQNTIKRTRLIWNLSEYNRIIKWLAISKFAENQQKILKLNRYTSKYGCGDGDGKNYIDTEASWLSIVQEWAKCIPVLK
jgi:hypothetical protein